MRAIKRPRGSPSYTNLMHSPREETMLSKLRPRSVYDVMAAIACFGVLATGTAYAANTVFSADIVDGEVKTPDIASYAVTNTKLASDSVGNPKLKTGAVNSAKVLDNSLTGTDIIESSLSGVKVSGLITTHRVSAYDSTSPKDASASCPAGTKVVGSGYYISGGKSGGYPDSTSAITVDQISNLNGGSGVYVAAEESQATSLDWSVQAEAVCANAE